MTQFQFDARVAERQSLIAWMAVAKDREMALRKELADFIVPGYGRGTHTVTVDTEVAFYKAKLVGKLNYKVDEEKAKENTFPGLVKWKPELSLTAYQALTDEQQKVANEMLTITPGVPELKIETVPK